MAFSDEGVDALPARSYTGPATPPLSSNLKD